LRLAGADRCRSNQRKYFFSIKAGRIKNLFNLVFLSFTKKTANWVLTVFVFAFLSVALTNAYFGIYQRGEVPQTILPYGIGGIYKWLLLFGLSSFAAIILKFEYSSGKNKSYLVAILSLMENFISNVSLLSRGMILNSAALFYGLFKDWKSSSIISRGRFLVVVAIIFVLLFVGSVLTVNYLRSNAAALGFIRDSSTEIGPDSFRHEQDLKRVQGMTTPLFIDRWVGIEGVLAVSSSKKIGWDLWHHAWTEVYSNHSTSFYDFNLVESPYLNGGYDKQSLYFITGHCRLPFLPRFVPVSVWRNVSDRYNWRRS